MEEESLKESLNDKNNNTELPLIEGLLDLNSQTTVTAETVAKIQAQLEGKVQKLLDKLTILTNNQYAKGKHVYDYQLVRLTEEEAKAKMEALQKAEEVFFKHSTLKRQEKEMNDKFEATQAQLNEYKDQFYKNREQLKHDYKQIKQEKEKTQKELQDQIQLQRETEISVNEALQQKAELKIKEIHEEMEKEKKQLAQEEAKM